MSSFETQHLHVKDKGNKEENTRGMIDLFIKGSYETFWLRSPRISEVYMLLYALYTSQYWGNKTACATKNSSNIHYVAHADLLHQYREVYKACRSMETSLILGLMNQKICSRTAALEKFMMCKMFSESYSLIIC